MSSPACAPSRAGSSSSVMRVDEILERVDERLERCPHPFVAAAVQHVPPLGVGELGGLGREPGLADSGFARDQRDAAALPSSTDRRMWSSSSSSALRPGEPEVLFVDQQPGQRGRLGTYGQASGGDDHRGGVDRHLVRRVELEVEVRTGHQHRRLRGEDAAAIPALPQRGRLPHDGCAVGVIRR